MNPQIGGNLSTAEEADQPPVCLRCRLVVRGAQSGRQDVISDRPRNAGPGSTPRAAPRPGRPPRALYGPPSRRTTGEPYGPTSGSLDELPPASHSTSRAEPSSRSTRPARGGPGPRDGSGRGALRSGRRPRAGERETRPRARSQLGELDPDRLTLLDRPWPPRRRRHRSRRRGKMTGAHRPGVEKPERSGGAAAVLHGGASTTKQGEIRRHRPRRQPGILTREPLQVRQVRPERAPRTARGTKVSAEP